MGEEVIRVCIAGVRVVAVAIVLGLRAIAIVLVSRVRFDSPVIEYDDFINAEDGQGAGDLADQDGLKLACLGAIHW